MKIHQIQQRQRLPIGKQQAWDFLSDPSKLSEITPKELGFQVISELPKKMYAGQIITYKVRPLLGIPQTWVTEITHLQEGQYFVDEQRAGPYKLWHHQHWLRSMSENEVEMIDQVDYLLPLGVLGNWAHHLFVRKQLETIFSYRKTKLEQLFPAKG